MAVRQAVRRIARTEIEAALRRVENGHALDGDANLLRAVYESFDSIAKVIEVNVELVDGTDCYGRPCHYLMMTYPNGKE